MTTVEDCEKKITEKEENQIVFRICHVYSWKVDCLIMTEIITIGKTANWLFLKISFVLYKIRWLQGYSATSINQVERTDLTSLPSLKISIQNFRFFTWASTPIDFASKNAQLLWPRLFLHVRLTKRFLWANVSKEKGEWSFIIIHFLNKDFRWYGSVQLNSIVIHWGKEEKILF